MGIVGDFKGNFPLIVIWEKVIGISLALPKKVLTFAVFRPFLTGIHSRTVPYVPLMLFNTGFFIVVLVNLSHDILTKIVCV